MGLLDEESIRHSGYLTAAGKLGFVKQRKFFALDEKSRALCIVRGEKDLRSRRSLPLVDVEKVTRDGVRITLHFLKTAAPPNNGRSFTVAAKSSDEAQEWVAALKSMLEEVRGSSEDRPEEDDENDDGSEEEIEVEEEVEVEVDIENNGVDSGDAKSVADLSWFVWLGGIVLKESGMNIMIGSGADSGKKAPAASQTRTATTKIKKTVKKVVKKRLSRKKGDGNKKKLDRKALKSEKTDVGKMIAKNIVSKTSGGGKLPAVAVSVSPPSSPKGKSKFRLFKKGSVTSFDGGDSEHQEGEQNKGPLTKEQLREKIAKQAKQYGGGDYLTGAATVDLTQDIAQSRIATNLAKKKAEFEKKQAEKARLEAEAKGKEKPKEKQTLSSFLAAQGGTKVAQDDEDEE